MQPRLKEQLDFQYPEWRSFLRWDGDNSEFVVDCVLPLMTWVDPDIKEVIQWAYGYGPDRSYEKRSNGSSFVEDKFFDGLAKDPQGVGHDYLYWLSNNRLSDPHRRIWTFKEASDWYYRASRQFGDGKSWSWIKRFGLDIFGWVNWGPYAIVKRK